MLICINSRTAESAHGAIAWCDNVTAAAHVPCSQWPGLWDCHGWQQVTGRLDEVRHLSLSDLRYDDPRTSSAGAEKRFTKLGTVAILDANGNGIVRSHKSGARGRGDRITLAHEKRCDFRQ